MGVFGHITPEDVFGHITPEDVFGHIMPEDNFFICVGDRDGDGDGEGDIFGHIMTEDIFGHIMTEDNSDLISISSSSSVDFLSWPGSTASQVQPPSPAPHS